MSQTTERLRDSTKFRVYLVLFFLVALSMIFILRGPTTVGVSETRSMSSKFPREMMVGGLGDVRENDDRVGPVVDKIKPILEEKSGIKFESLEVIHYKPQVVAGTNYFVKAKAKPADGSDEQIVHLRIYQNLKKELDLTAYQLNKAVEDKLEYFQ